MSAAAVAAPSAAPLPSGPASAAAAAAAPGPSGISGASLPAYQQVPETKYERK